MGFVKFRAIGQDTEQDQATRASGLQRGKPLVWRLGIGVPDFVVGRAEHLDNVNHV